jgi:hypothetical protein
LSSLALGLAPAVAAEAQTVIAFEEAGGQATVKDRMLVEFDEDTKAGKVSNLRFRNFASESAADRNVERSCPPPSPKHAYERIDRTSATQDGSGAFEFRKDEHVPGRAVRGPLAGRLGEEIRQGEANSGIDPGRQLAQTRAPAARAKRKPRHSGGVSNPA